NKHVDFTNVPKRGKLYDWKNSIGLICRFTYDDISGELEIIDYKNRFITIKYKDKIDTIGITSFTNCSIGNILGIKTKDFKIEIGDNFKSDKRDLTIIDREYRISKDKRIWKWYKYRC